MSTYDSIEWDPPGDAWALLFWHQQEVPGERFNVRVSMHGRLLATIDPETGACSIDGVYPGALYGGGASLDEADTDLRASLGMILDDIMESSADAEEFQQRLDGFLRATDDTTVSEWNGALARLRSGESEGAPALESRDASAWDDHVSVIPASQPIIALPAPPQNHNLAFAA